MKQQLKTILLNQYIGAIMIAILWVQGIVAIATVLGDPIYLLLEKILHSSNARLDAPTSLLSASALVLTLIRVLLNFLIGYLIALWLYAEEKPAQASEPATHEDPA